MGTQGDGSSVRNPRILGTCQPKLQHAFQPNSHRAFNLILNNESVDHDGYRPSNHFRMSSWMARPWRRQPYARSGLSRAAVSERGPGGEDVLDRNRATTETARPADRTTAPEPDVRLLMLRIVPLIKRNHRAGLSRHHSRHGGSPCHQLPPGVPLAGPRRGETVSRLAGQVRRDAYDDKRCGWRLLLVTKLQGQCEEFHS